MDFQEWKHKQYKDVEFRVAYRRLFHEFQVMNRKLRKVATRQENQERLGRRA